MNTQDRCFGPHSNGAALALGVAALYFAIQAIAVYTSPIVGTFCGDETINYYQAARNFNTYGFLRSTFLQDFSTSSAAEEHAFVYDHMAPGPEIVVALLTRALGERYWLVRLFFTAVFLCGLYYFYKFGAILLANLGLHGAGYAFLLLLPASMTYLIESPGHATFPWLAFYPLVAVQRWHSGGSAWGWWRGVAAIVLSTWLLSYQQVLLILTNAFMLAWLKLFPLTKRDVLWFAGAALLGLVVHLGQNVWHLGLKTASQELSFTLSNRMTGQPSAEDLVSFYQSINVVHHGRHTFRANKLLIAFLHSVNRRLLQTMAIVGLLLLVCQWVIWQWVVCRAPSLCSTPQTSFPRHRNIENFMKLAAWCLASIAVPVFAFPAYSIDFNLQGTGHFLSALLGLTFFLYAWQALASLPLKGRALSLGTVLFALAFVPLAVRQTTSIIKAAHAACVKHYVFVEELASRTEHLVTMTNMYPTTVGFFSREKVFGVAELEAFAADGSPLPHFAYHKFIRNLQASDVYRPSLYIFSRVLLPGHARSVSPDYAAALHEFLLAHHHVVYEDEHVTIFELTQR